MGKEAKTNAMRMLERAKVSYTAHEYPHEEGQAVDGANVARLTGQDPARVFKTLVTQGKSRAFYVFVIPATGSLNLKRAAAACGEKAVEMIPQKALLPNTGYIHGGCSPIGMKKLFHTTIHESARNFPTILCSAGKNRTPAGAFPGQPGKGRSVPAG